MITDLSPIKIKHIKISLGKGVEIGLIMKYDINIKKFSPYDASMLGNIMAMSERDMMKVMLDKGDIEYPLTKNEHLANFDMPKGKNMKAADRRKQTFHKHKQREKRYRNWGYHLERFSSADIGKMREGVGMFPETQHQYSMSNSMRLNGSKKKEKPISTQQAMEMMEEERLLDEQDAQKEYEEAERLFMMDEMETLMNEVCYLNNQIEYANAHVSNLMERIDELNDSIFSMWNRRHLCLEKIEKMQEVLNK